MTTNNIWNSTMQNGLILGIIFSANFLLNVSEIGLLGILTLFIPFLILWMTYRYLVKYRDTDCNGAISYTHGLLYTILLFFFASLISAVVKFVYFRFINTEILKEEFNKSMENYERMAEMMQGRFPMDMDRAYESMEILSDPLNYTLLMIWANVFIAFFIGLILARIVKKEKSIFDKNQDDLPKQNF